MSLRTRLAAWLAPPLPTPPAPMPSLRAAAAPVREAAPTDANDALNGFRRLTSSTSALTYFRDLPPGFQDQMLRYAQRMWERNPLAKWILETTVDFVLGEGAKVESDAETVQAVIDGFWNDPVNQLEMRLDSFTREFGMNGELCLPAAVNGIDGHVRLGYVDPFDIGKVILDPDNSLMPISIELRSLASPSERRVLKVIREETARASSYYGLMMPALPGERCPVLDVPYTASCFLFQTNKISNGRRGRSDILPDIDWLDGYDSFLFDAMDNANLFNSFVYDATLEGFTEEQITSWLKTFGSSIKRGGVFAHNEKVKLNHVTPDLKAPDKAEWARLYRGHILGSHSYPEHWYGLAGEVNFASAKEMGLPPVKRLTRRQKEVRFIISTLVRFALHQAILAGTLTREVVIGKADAAGNSSAVTKPVDQAFRIILPELSMRDQASTVAAVTSLVAALVQAKGEGWISGETSARLFANLVSQLGMEVEAKDEYDPQAAQKTATADYSQQSLERILAQLTRQGNGNGDNINQPKKDSRVQEALAELTAVVRTMVERPTPAPVVNAPVTVTLPEPMPAPPMRREYQRDERGVIVGHIDHPVVEETA